MKQTVSKLPTGTTSPILNKVFEADPEKEKLGLLDNQLQHMGDDFELMKRAREQSKKQLEARFQDIQRKINSAKEFILSEGNRINNTLVAFQIKFETEMKNLRKELGDQHSALKDATNAGFARTDGEMKRLDEKLEEQKRERIKQSSQSLKQLRDKIGQLFEMAETERSTRVEREKFILGKLSDQAFRLDQALRKQQGARELKHKQLKDYIDYEIKSQQKFSQGFFKSTKEEFNHVAEHLSAEMKNRAEEQNSVVNNISKVVKTIQETLKIIGKSA